MVAAVGVRDKLVLVLVGCICSVSLVLANPDWTHSFEHMGVVMKDHPDKVLATFKADPALVRQTDLTRRTVLHMAAQSGNRQLIKFLVSQGLDLEKATLGGITPLIAACIAQNVEAASTLLELGANAKGKYPDTPLHLVAGCGRGLCARIPEKDSDWLALARLLLERGANPNAKSDNDATPLQYAAEANNPAMIALLLLRGAKPDGVDSDGNTALHTAVRTVSQRSVEALLKGGCRTDIRNKAGETPLDMAKKAKLSQKIIQLLSK